MHWGLPAIRVIVPVLCCAASALCQGNQKLLGKWRSVVTSDGGIGAVVDFHSDGTFDYSPGAVIGGQYRIQGNQVITAYENGEPENAMTIESITAEKLSVKLPGAVATLDFKRVGRVENPGNLLLGVWVTVRTMQGSPSHGYYYFRSDGRETFNIPFRTDHCAYAIAGNQIRLRAGGRSMEGTLRWEDDVLVLPWGRGEAKFKRF